MGLRKENTNIESKYGLGGVCLLSRDVEQRSNRNMYFITIITVILGVIFYRGIREGSWLNILVFAALRLYLQGVSVRISERTDISLGTSAVIPMIYLTGSAPAMAISILLGIYDGIRNKKPWRRTMFNAAQFALSSLFAALSLEYLTNLLGGTGLGFVVAVTIATGVYIFCNIGLVCYIVAIWRSISWWAQMKTVLRMSFFSSLSSGFIGIIFTFFVISYGFWGLIAFSMLLVNLSGLLKAAAEVSAERALRAELEEELVIDEMTGANNFRYLNNWLSEPSDEQIALLFMDIDNFAVFNNTYGHAEGDKVLRKLVETIHRSVRTDDQVIRYGGDEFVVFLEGMDAQGARGVAERIMDNLASLKDPKWSQPITVSLGISAKPQDTGDKRQLLLFADQAMYKAKHSGKNTIQMWSTLKDPA
ncbi:MAG TPA: hypothetical protein DDZ66_03115 [Firmicutes bacterium]|nr:hypothetical protein [Bacillota bacterium]